MSHNILIKNVKITSIEALQAAVDELRREGKNITLNRDRKTFRTYPGQPDKCDMCIELPNARFDVGLVKQPDGTYLTVYDPYLAIGGTEISCSLDPRERDERHGIAMLTQRYSVIVSERELALQGHMCRREKGENGEIHVVAEVG